MWKTLKECSRYEISEYGTIREKETGKFRKATINNRGYYIISIILDDGVRKSFQIHRLVASNFLPAPSQEIIDGYKNHKNKSIHVDHKDGYKFNNHYSNLRWCTPKKNIENAINHTNRWDKGVKSQFSKLSEEQLDELTSAYYNGTLDTKLFACKFNVNVSTINKYLRNAGIRQRAKRS